MEIQFSAVYLSILQMWEGYVTFLSPNFHFDHEDDSSNPQVSSEAEIKIPFWGERMSVWEKLWRWRVGL